MRTDKQTEASRTNGAKSQGPKTPEGKAKSAQNGNRHNLAGGHIVLLSNESPDQFKAFSFGYLDAFAPANFVERDLVFQLIAASWRLARISAMESAIIELEMWRQEETHAETFDYLNSHTRHVLTFLNMNNEEDGMRKLHPLPDRRPSRLQLRLQTTASPPRRSLQPSAVLAARASPRRSRN